MKCETHGCRDDAKYRVENPSGRDWRTFVLACETHAPPEHKRTDYNCVAIAEQP